jgi:hypothetical protein
MTRLELDALRGLRLIADTGTELAARRARRALRLVDDAKRDDGRKAKR